MALNNPRGKFVENICLCLLNRISKKYNCTSEVYARKMIAVILNRTKCSFYVKYVELLYDIDDTDLLKAFYQRKKSKVEHDKLKLIYNIVYRMKPNYCIIDNNGIMSHNMKLNQELIDKIEQENSDRRDIKNNDNAYDNQYMFILPELISREIDSIKPKESTINKRKSVLLLSNEHDLLKKQSKKEDNSIDSVECFILLISNIETKTIQQMDSHYYNSISNTQANVHKDNNTSQTTKTKIDMNSIRNSIVPLDNFRLNQKRLKTTKKAKIFISLNKKKSYYNSMFPSTRSFFFQMNKNKNKLNEMRSSLHEALIESSLNKQKCEMQKYKIKLPVFKSVIKQELSNDNGLNGYVNHTYLNLHTYTQMSLFKYRNNENVELKKRKESEKKYFLLSKRFNSNNTSTNMTEKSNNFLRISNNNNTQYRIYNEYQAIPKKKKNKILRCGNKNKKGLKISMVTIK